MDKVKAFYEAHKGKIKYAVVFVLGGLTAVGVKVPDYVPVLLAALGLN